MAGAPGMTTATEQEMEAFEFALRYPGKGRRAKGDSTVKVYRQTVGKFLQFLAGEAPAREAAAEFVEMLEESNSPRSLARHIYALRAYFQWKGIELDMGAPVYRRPLPSLPSIVQWTALLQTAQKPLQTEKTSQAGKRRAVMLMAALMVYSAAGLRLSEGCKLRRVDIDPRGYLTVHGKGNRDDRVPVEMAVITALQDQIALHQSDWVFPGRDGPLSPRQMQRLLGDLAGDCGIEIPRFVHSLRHFRGRTLRTAGMDIRDIQSLLRHADIGSTQIYAHLEQSDLRKRMPRTVTSWRQRPLLAD